MKIDKVTLEKLRAAISSLDTPFLREQYQTGNIARADTVKNIDVRYSHDLLWAAINCGLLTYGELEGYNDAHIATALRNIVPKLEVAA